MYFVTLKVAKIQLRLCFKVAQLTVGNASDFRHPKQGKRMSGRAGNEQ
jgi:hypothetical protein